MSPYRRNVMVGATVIVSLAVLGWMILKFGGQVAVPFAPPTITVKFVTDRADGVADGSPISYRGIESGHVTRVWLDEESKSKVFFEGSISTIPALPGNLIGRIRTASALGSGSIIALDTDGPPSADMLKKNQLIQAKYVGLGELIPMEEIGELAIELTKISRQVRETNVIGHLDEQVRSAGQVITSIQGVIGDDKTRQDIKASIANIRATSDSAKTIAANFEKFSKDLQKLSVDANTTIGETRVQISKAGNNIDSLSRQMGDRLTQIARLLDQAQSIGEKIDKGQGSAGQLINDPRLYESLVDTSRELNATIKDFKRLVEQWEQEGVSLKVK